MKIISGIHGGRNLFPPEDKSVRPTSAKMRAAIFNILASGNFVDDDGLSIINDARVLDICCGTGALGLEAISRGASKAVFIDGSSQHLKIAWQNICNLGEQEKSIILRCKAENLPKAREKFNLVFLDPPYNKNIIPKSLGSLIEKDWLEKDAIIFSEMGRTEDIVFVKDQFEQLDIRTYGNSKVIILKKLN